MNTDMTFRQKLEDASWIITPTSGKCAWVKEEYECNTKNPPSLHVDPVLEYLKVLCLFRKRKYYGWLIITLTTAVTVAFVAVIISQIITKPSLIKNHTDAFTLSLVISVIGIIALIVVKKFSDFWNDYLELFIKSEWTTHQFPDDFVKFREIGTGYWYQKGSEISLVLGYLASHYKVPDHVRTKCREHLAECARDVKQHEINNTIECDHMLIANSKSKFNYYFQIFRRIHGIPRDIYEKYYYDIAVEQIRCEAKKALEATELHGKVIKV